MDDKIFYLPKPFAFNVSLFFIGGVAALIIVIPLVITEVYIATHIPDSVRRENALADYLKAHGAPQVFSTQDIDSAIQRATPLFGPTEAQRQDALSAYLSEHKK